MPKVTSTPTPNISFIVSLYNRPIYLPSCLWSLVGQSYQDFEVIVTDNTEDNKVAKKQRTIVEGFNNRFPQKFTYLRSFRKIKVNDCYWSAEYGMKYAVGKWLVFPCEDCYYPPYWSQMMLGRGIMDNLDLVLCEEIIGGPDNSGAPHYTHLQMGNVFFPGYKPSFIVKSSKFKRWINKPTVGACSGVDRTTLQAMVRDPRIRWGVCRNLTYFHN